MKLVVIGAGGHAKVVTDTARLAGWQVVGFCDDRPDAALWDLPHLGKPLDLKISSDTYAIIAIGQNHVRKKLVSQMPLHTSWATIVHPRTSISSSAVVLEGSVVFAGAVIQADSFIGRHAIVNTLASVDHDCHVEDYGHVAPHAALTGGVNLKEGVFVGTGASILPSRLIGSWTTVGAGAVVTRDLQPDSVYVGIPAQLVS